MLEIRFATEEDKAQILAVIREVFGEEQAGLVERRWHWQWHQDPWLERPGSFGAVAVFEGKVVGSVSGIPMGLYIEGQHFPANWTTDICVSWGNLRRALKALKRSGKPGGEQFPNGLSAALIEFAAEGHGQAGKHITETGTAVLLKMGCKPLPHAASWNRILSFRPLLEPYLGRFAAGLIGSLADWALPAIPQPTIPIQILTGEFDERFDELWQLARQTYPAITRRDRATLNWRYRQHPDQQYTVLIAETEGRLLGYLVYNIYYRHQQRRAFLVDVLTGIDDSATRLSLLAQALGQLKLAGVHKVECYASHPVLIADLKTLRFKTRTRNGRGQDTLARNMPQRDYYFTRGDGDGG